MDYNAIIVPESGQPFLLNANSVEELVSLIKTYCGTETCAFPYFGTPLGITKGPRRQLRDTNNKLYPLYDTVVNGVEIDPTGSLN